ncbi:MAG: hypothetical protein ACRDGN_02490 [bacterium]
MRWEEKQNEELSRLVARVDPRLFDQLQDLARRRMVFFAGLPGTGKSLLTHQLAHLAHARGRVVHLLQWDVARPAIEASDAGTRYPQRDGVSHGLIRMAAGLWARAAVVEWAAHGPEHLLIGETPCVGHRFIELARRADDEAEPLLSASECRFVIPVPSREVREFLEAERERRMTRPLHAQEREDAPPQVLRALWGALVRVAETLGIASGAPTAPGGSLPAHDPAAGVPYDPRMYQRVYQAVLKHRHTDIVALDTILPTEAFSVYDFAVARRDLIPTPRQAARFIDEVEARFPDMHALEREVARWWVM